MRVIAHADMDAFYAAVEQLDDPRLRNKPILVGHPGKRSVVTTASYEARPYGVGSAMPMSKAMRLCPQAIVVPPRFERYREVSGTIMAVFRRFSPAVEALSLDEAFLDLTGTEPLLGPPLQVAQRIKQAVREATGGLTVSVGVAPTKFVAKVASDIKKPDGLLVIAPEQTQAFLDPLPVRRLWGVGKHAEAELHAIGLRTIHDVRRADRDWLVTRLGSLGAHIAALSRGEDLREVDPDRESKSIGHEDTLAEDIHRPGEAMPLLLRAADIVAARLRAEDKSAAGVRVKLKTASFHLLTRQMRLISPARSATPLYDAAVRLLDEFPWDEPLRLVGLQAYDLLAEGAPLQRDLFTAGEERKQRKLDDTLDALKKKFGDDAVQRASRLARRR